MDKGYRLKIIEDSVGLVKTKIVCTDKGKEPKNNCPIFTFCRKLLAKGYSEDTRLEIYRESNQPDVIIPRIGVAAKLAIRENEWGKRFKNAVETEIQPRIIKYRASPYARKAQIPITVDG